MRCVGDKGDESKNRAAAGMGGCLTTFIPAKAGHARGGFIRSLLPELMQWGAGNVTTRDCQPSTRQALFRLERIITGLPSFNIGFDEDVFRHVACVTKAWLPAF